MRLLALTPFSRPIRTPLATRLLAGTALVAGSIGLVSCGGGGGGGRAGASGLSQTDVEVDAANGSQIPGDGASALDNVFDTARIVAGLGAQGAGADRIDVACPGGGTVSYTVTGGNSQSGTDGRFRVGEHYAMQFSQCRGRLDLAQLDGAATLDVTAASASAGTRSAQAAIALQGLTTTLSLGAATWTGRADLSRTVVDGAAGASTSSSELASPDLEVDTAFHGRHGQFSLTAVQANRTVDSQDGVPVKATLAGSQTLTGNAFGRHFSIHVDTEGEVAYDATGTPVSGTWTAVHGHATVRMQIASGQVTVRYDRDSDGTPERTWTFPLSHLLDSEG